MASINNETSKIAVKGTSKADIISNTGKIVTGRRGEFKFAED